MSLVPVTVAYDAPPGVNSTRSGFAFCFVLCATRPFFMSHMATHASAPQVIATAPVRCTLREWTPPRCALSVLSASHLPTLQMIKLPSTPPETRRVGSEATLGP